MELSCGEEEKVICGYDAIDRCDFFRIFTKTQLRYEKKCESDWLLKRGIEEHTC